MIVFNKLKYLFLYNVFISYFKISGDINNSIINKNKVKIIENKTINGKILEEYPNVEYFIFKNCVINISLPSVFKYLLINSDITSLNANNSFILVDDQTIEFYNIKNYNQYYNLLRYYDNLKLKEVKFVQCVVEDNNIEIVLKIIDYLYKKYKISDINILNCNYLESVLNKIRTFAITNNIRVIISKSNIKSNINQDDVIDFIKSNMENDNQNNNKTDDNNLIPKNIKDLEILLSKYTDILCNTTRDELFSIFKKYLEFENKKKRNMLGKKEEEELSYLKTQLETFLKLPKNAIIRKDLSYDLLTLLITKIFRISFPSGLDEVLQMLINLSKTAITKGKVEYKNTILNGPPGIGKTSVTKLIAYVLCLIGSNEKLIPLKLLKESQTNDAKLVELIEILENNYYRHIVVINLNGVNDAASLKGTNSFYVGATTGKIVSSISTGNIQGPVLILMDEIDKMGVDKNGQSNNKQTVGSTLLNLFDGQLWEDVFLKLALNLKNNIIYLGTSNVKENIDSTLANRFTIINIAPPTLEGKKQIILSIFVKLCVENKLIKNIKDYQVMNNGKSYKIGPFILDDDILMYLINITHKTDGLRDVIRYIEELFNNLFVEYTYSKKDININQETLIKYLAVNDLEEDHPTQNVLNIIYENKDGNNILGQVYLLKLKNNNGRNVHILGSNQENYYSFMDLGLLVEGILKNLSTLCTDINSNFGLSLVTQYFINQQGGLLLQIPTNGTDDEYKNYIVIYLILGAISLIRDIRFKNEMMPIGVVLPNGDFSIGKGKIQNKIIAATKFNMINVLILPKTLEKNKMFQAFLKKNNIKHKIYYCSNLSQVLSLMLINN